MKEVIGLCNVSWGLLYFVKINGGEPLHILVRADLQTVHVHTVNLGELHVLRLLHQELYDDLVKCFLEVNAMGTPGSEELDHHIFIGLDKFLKCVVI